MEGLGLAELRGRHCDHTIKFGETRIHALGSLVAGGHDRNDAQFTGLTNSLFLARPSVNFGQSLCYKTTGCGKVGFCLAADR